MRTTAILLIAGSALLCMNMRAAEPPKAAEPVKAKEANALNFTGTIEAATAKIRPRVTGYLEKIAVKEGATVKKGDLLAELDARLYKARWLEARARLTAAKASLKAANASLERLKKAAEKGVVDQSEVVAAQAEVERCEAFVDAEQAHLDLADLEFSYTRLVSPMEGRVGKFAETAGNLVTADGPPLVTVVAIDPLFVAFDVDEATILTFRRNGIDLTKLEAGVALGGEEDYPHKAIIDFVDPQFNPTTGTVRVRGVIANPKGLLSPGMFVRVKLTLPAK
jgi:RND family efflux transporter MFP subunit